MLIDNKTNKENIFRLLKLYKPSFIMAPKSWLELSKYNDKIIEVQEQLDIVRAEKNPIKYNQNEEEVPYIDESNVQFFLNDIEDLSTDDRIPIPKWYPVKYAFDDPHDKETGPVVLASFACVEYDYDFLLSHEQIALEEKLYVPGTHPK